MARGKADLAVIIGGDDKQLQQAIRRAQSTVRKFGSEIKSNITTTIKWTSVIAGVGAAITTHLVKKQLQAVDATAKFADMIGEGTRELVGLQHAAAITAGVTDQQFNMALQRMVRRLAEAAQGTGEAQGAIKALGLDAQELARMGPAAAFEAISEAIQDVENQGERVRIAFKLFDSEGAKLVNTLNAGPEAIRALIDEADQLGISFSRVDAARIEAANNAMARVGGVVRGIGNTIAIEVSGPIEAVANHLTEAAKNSDGFRESIRQMTNAAITGMGNALIKAGDLLGFLNRNPGIIEFGVVGAILFGKRGAAIGALIGAVFGRLRREFAKLGIGADEDTAKMLSLEDKLEKVNAEVETSTRIFGENAAVTQRWKARQEEVNAEIDALRQKMAGPEWTAFEEQWGKTAGTFAKVARGAREMGQVLIDAANAPPPPLLRSPEGTGDTPTEDQQSEAERTAFERRIEQLRNQFVTEQELKREHQQALIDLDTAYREGQFETEAEYLALIEEMQRQHMDRLKQIRERGLTDLEKFTSESFKNQAKTVAGELADITAGVAQHSKTMFNINKTAGIAMAIINAYEGISRTLAAYPYPLNIAMAAAHGAAAFAQVQAIRSQQFGGGGGAAPSLAGGTPATPVTPVSGGTPQGGGSQQLVNISLQGEFFGRQTVIGLIESINEAVADGARLRVA